MIQRELNANPSMTADLAALSNEVVQAASEGNDAMTPEIFQGRFVCPQSAAMRVHSFLQVAIVERAAGEVAAYFFFKFGYLVQVRLSCYRRRWDHSGAEAAVPKLCPDPAFLPFLTCLPEHRISNLQIPGVGWGIKSPSPHHSFQKI